jgi:hypothetical protein
LITKIQNYGFNSHKIAFTQRKNNSPAFTGANANIEDASINIFRTLDKELAQCIDKIYTNFEKTPFENKKVGDMTYSLIKLYDGLHLIAENNDRFINLSKNGRLRDGKRGNPVKDLSAEIITPYVGERSIHSLSTRIGSFLDETGDPYYFARIYDLRNNEDLYLRSSHTVSPEQIANSQRASELLEELRKQLIETLKILDVDL